jgi:Lar family restriction alleviation protein
MLLPEIKKCPFCGYDDIWTDKFWGSHYAVCLNCLAKDPYKETKRQAITAWNKPNERTKNEHTAIFKRVRQIEKSRKRS